MKKIIKLFFAFVLSLILLFNTQDIISKTIGGFLLIWVICNVLGYQYYTFEVISNILDMIIGLSFVVFGIILAISESEWLPLVFSAFGILIMLQGLLPIIYKIRNKKAITDIEEGEQEL